MGPTCAEDDARYPDGAVHQSCADARVFEESGGWLHNGPRIELPDPRPHTGPRP